MSLIAKQRFVETDLKVSHWTTAISASAAFLLMFQIYMIAPLLDQITIDLNADGMLRNLLIPSITVTIGLSSLFSGRLADYFGIKNFTIMSAASLALTASLVFICESMWSLIAVRLISGILLGGILPLSFRFTARNYPAEKRFTPIMIIVFGMAGGMTFGPVFGALALDRIGWRMEFALVGLISLGLLLLVGYLSSFIPIGYSSQNRIKDNRNNNKKWIAKGNRVVILLFILINGILHSGLFVWTIGTIHTRYTLGNMSAGMVLLDFGLPGLLLVVILGIFSKGPSSIKMEIIGLILLSVCLIMIVFNFPLLITLVAVALLSVGYNITQPLFFGIVGKLADGHEAQIAVQTGCCFLFTGYGLGPIIFSFLMNCGHSSAILLLVVLLASLAMLSRLIFRSDG
jgi:MFS family permease